MMATRRAVLSWAANAVGACILPSPIAAAESVTGERIKAVAFYAFVIFDPRPISVLAEELFPKNGAQLSEVWRARQFEYT